MLYPKRGDSGGAALKGVGETGLRVSNRYSREATTYHEGGMSKEFSLVSGTTLPFNTRLPHGCKCGSIVIRYQRIPPPPRPSENKSIHFKLSSMCQSASKAVLSRMQLTLHASRPNISRRFALGASNVGLVGEKPVCSVPAL